MKNIASFESSTLCKTEVDRVEMATMFFLNNGRLTNIRHRTILLLLS